MIGDVYIFGYRLKKTIIVPTIYKEVKSRPITIAKNYIKTFLKTSKYKQFKLENIERLNCNKEQLEITI